MQYKITSLFWKLTKVSTNNLNAYIKGTSGRLKMCKDITTVYREYVYSAVVYQKYLTRLRELIIFEPWRENYHFSQPS